MKEKKVNGFDKWEVEDALRALERAAEVKAQPKLFAAAQEFAKKKVKQIKSIADLKDELKSKTEEDMD